MPQNKFESLNKILSFMKHNLKYIVCKFKFKLYIK